MRFMALPLENEKKWLAELKAALALLKCQGLFRADVIGVYYAREWHR